MYGKIAYPLCLRVAFFLINAHLFSGSPCENLVSYHWGYHFRKWNPMGCWTHIPRTGNNLQTFSYPSITTYPAAFTWLQLLFFVHLYNLLFHVHSVFFCAYKPLCLMCFHSGVQCGLWCVERRGIDVILNECAFLHLMMSPHWTADFHRVSFSNKGEG